MKLEVAKTYVLVILVGLSLLLTFSLWSYQPNHELLTNSQSKYLNEGDFDLGGKEVRKKEIIKPKSIIFHTGEQSYGFSDPMEGQALYEDLQSWVLYDFTTGEANDRPKDENQVEIIFPTELPIAVVSSIFTLNEDEELPNWSFQRVYITFDENKTILNLHFLSVDGRQKAKAVVNNASKYNLLWGYISNHDELRQLVAFNESGVPVYIPKNSVKMTKRSLAIENSDPNMLKNALFRNPSLVSRNLTNINVVYYTDGQRQMRIFQDRRSMEFINPYQPTYERMNPVDLIDRSLLNINEYKGWTNDYNLESIDAASNRIRFQMFYEGYPVYSNDDFSIIEQQWRNHELSQYKRPLFSIANTLGSDEVELMSGNDVIFLLKNSTNYKLENIKDIQIGYNLHFHDSASNTLILEPEWFVEYNGTWEVVKFDDDTLARSKGVS